MRAHLSSRPHHAEPPQAPCLQSTEGLSPIPITKDALGAVIGRKSIPEFTNDMTMSGS